MSFQQNAIVFVLVAMVTNIERMMNCADEFYKPVKFQKVRFELILKLHFLFPVGFGSAAMTSYLTSLLWERDIKSKKWRRPYGEVI